MDVYTTNGSTGVLDGNSYDLRSLQVTVLSKYAIIRKPRVSAVITPLNYELFPHIRTQRQMLTTPKRNSSKASFSGLSCFW